MSRRRGVTLIEIVVAGALLVLVLVPAVDLSLRLAYALRRESAWQDAALAFESLLRRFAVAPCADAPAGDGALSVGAVAIRWRVMGDSGRLEVVDPPVDAPAALRRGALRGTLPC